MFLVCNTGRFLFYRHYVHCLEHDQVLVLRMNFPVRGDETVPCLYDDKCLPLNTVRSLSVRQFRCLTDKLLTCESISSLSVSCQVRFFVRRAGLS